MIAILVVASMALGFIVITLGFVIDHTIVAQLTARRMRLTREEVAAYKREILHHINHLTVRKRPSERAMLRGEEVHTERPAARARKQRGD